MRACLKAGRGRFEYGDDQEDKETEKDAVREERRKKAFLRSGPGGRRTYRAMAVI